MKSLIIILFFGFCFSIQSRAQIDLDSVDLVEFIKDSQVQKQGDKKLFIAWWIPIEFWIITLNAEKSLTDAQRSEMIAALDSYTMFAFVNGEMSKPPEMEFVPYDTAFKNSKIIDAKGKTHLPIKMEDLNMQTEMLLSMFKPAFKKMMGDMGENMHFLVFSDEAGKGARVADPKVNGKIQFIYKEENFTWHTPLNSLTPPKYCPKNNEAMNGKWTYCPWHGEKLLEQKK